MPKDFEPAIDEGALLGTSSAGKDGVSAPVHERTQ
jgi:hypothetical protein